jgi:hypothetical protein
VRYSQPLETPLVVAAGSSIMQTGRWCAGRVAVPEVTELQGENARGAPARSRGISADRAPELRGMLASFGALFGAIAPSSTAISRRPPARLALATDADAATRNRSAARVRRGAGSGDRARCFTLAELDNDASVLAPESRARWHCQPLERRTLAAWCAESRTEVTRGQRGGLLAAWIALFAILGWVVERQLVVGRTRLFVPHARPGTADSRGNRRGPCIADAAARDQRRDADAVSVVLTVAEPMPRASSGYRQRPTDLDAVLDATAVSLPAHADVH